MRQEFILNQIMEYQLKNLNSQELIPKINSIPIGAQETRFGATVESLDYYDFFLPEELIATRPVADPRCEKLMVLQAGIANTIHDQFSNIENYLRQGDVLVVNNTKVRKAKLIAKKKTGGKAEIILLRPLENGNWEALVFAKGFIRENTELILEAGHVSVMVLRNYTREANIYEIACASNLEIIAENQGELPLPPYFRRRAEPEDDIRYQTMFAKHLGAVAAPTAGLHFTSDILDSLKSKGIQIVEITLHVGPGTFLPIRCNNISEHSMHSEFFELSETAASALNQAKKQGRRIIAVGTTSMRVLEQVSTWAKLKKAFSFFACRDQTSLFIKPGYQFLACNGIITNFHVPRSTLLVLVAAVSGRDRILKAYQEAIARKYRFFSYGDACFLEIGNQFHG